MLISKIKYIIVIVFCAAIMISQGYAFQYRYHDYTIKSLVQEGNFEKAEKKLLKQLNKINNNNTKLIQLIEDIGTLYINKGEYLNAINYLERILKISENSNMQDTIIIHNKLGFCYENNLIFNKALSHYALAINCQSSICVQSLINLANILNKLGFNDLAIKLLQNKVEGATEVQKNQIYIAITNLLYKQNKIYNKYIFNILQRIKINLLPKNERKKISLIKAFISIKNKSVNDSTVINNLTSLEEKAIIKYWEKEYSLSQEIINKRLNKIDVFTTDQTKFSIFLLNGIYLFRENQLEGSEASLRRAVEAIENIRASLTLSERLLFFQERTNTLPNIAPHLFLMALYAKTKNNIQLIDMAERIKTRIFADKFFKPKIRSQINNTPTSLLPNEYKVVCDSILFGKAINKCSHQKISMVYGPSLLTTIYKIYIGQLKERFKNKQNMLHYLFNFKRDISKQEIVKLQTILKHFKEMGIRNSLTSIIDKEGL